MLSILNVLVLCGHIAVICSLTLLCLRLGREFLIPWLALLALTMNLFVIKQITLLGLEITCSDALAIGYLLGLSLVQEYYGAKLARKIVWISFFISACFLLLSQIHLAYLPNAYDQYHNHFLSILSLQPRLVIASLFTFLIVQMIDITLFAYLRLRWKGRYLTYRTLLVLLASQGIDTTLFSFLGLYGIVHSIGQIILFSICIKVAIIVLSSPFIGLSKKMGVVPA